MTSVLLHLTMLLPVALPEHDPTRRVHDFANLLPAAERQALEALCRDVETKTTAQFAIVTVTSIDGKLIEDYANELFNKWGIGRADVNNGVMLLVAPEQRRIRIEVGRGLESLLTDRLCGDIRDEFIVPAFRNNSIPAGMKAGAERIAEILRKYPEAARGDPGSAPLWVRTKKRDALMGLGGAGMFAGVLAILGFTASWRRNYSTVVFFLAVAVAAAVGFAAGWLLWKAPKSPMLWSVAAAVGAALSMMIVFNVRRYSRYGPNACRKCGTRLELLDEKADDEKLSEVQQLEERLGSVDYDVWFCPACLKSLTERYLAWFSEFTQCPSCKARAFHEGSQEILRHPTTWQTGLAQYVGTCMSCKKRSVRNETLARIAAASSSSGWSSGGSTFSGGGGGGGGGRELRRRLQRRRRRLGKLVTTMMYYTIAAAIICGAIVVWYLLTFNLLVQSRNAVDQAWSNIEVELKRRFDLVQNLVEIAKGYAKHESETFRKVAELRTNPGAFHDAASANAAQPELARAVKQIFVLAENYPQLRADQSFLQLQSELATTENRIAERRHAYNQNVNLYQNRCQFVPSNLVAGLHRFPEKSFFDAPDEFAAAAPTVSL